MKSRLILSVITLGLLAQQALAIQLLQPGPTRLEGVIQWDTAGAMEIVLAKGSRSEQHVRIVAFQTMENLLGQANSGNVVLLSGTLFGTYDQGFFFLPDGDGPGSGSEEQKVIDIVENWWNTSNQAPRTRSDGIPKIRVLGAEGSFVRVRVTRTHVLGRESLGQFEVLVDLGSARVYVAD